MEMTYRLVPAADFIHGRRLLLELPFLLELSVLRVQITQMRHDPLCSSARPVTMLEIEQKADGLEILMRQRQVRRLGLERSVEFQPDLAGPAKGQPLDRDRHGILLRLCRHL